MVDCEILGDVPSALATGQAGSNRAPLMSCELRLTAHSLASFDRQAVEYLFDDLHYGAQA